MFAEIVVDTYQDPTKKLFTYSVPREMKGRIKTGTKVLVPFGKRSVEGYVWELKSSKPPFPTKPIKEARGTTFPPSQIKLARWMSHHYAAPPIDCLKCQLTGRGKRYTEGKKSQIETLHLVPYTAQVKLKGLELAAAERKTTLIGSRSAVFTSLPRLKRIVIEEPENWTYKDERSPYYHTKDVAQKRAELEGLELGFRYVVPRVEDFAASPNLLPSPPPPNSLTVIDMKKERGGGNFSRLGSDATKALRRARRALVYVNSLEVKESITQTIKEHALDVNRTEIAGPQIFSKVGKAFDYAVIADADTLFNLPDFRSHEKLLLIIAKINKVTKGSVFIQTNSADHVFFAKLKKGDPKNFYARELEARKPLLYPPFGVLAKLEFSAKTTAKVEVAAEKLYKKLTANSERLTAIKISPPYPPYAKTRGKAQLNIAVKARSRGGLEKVLTQVPPTWRIIVDPESLL